MAKRNEYIVIKMSDIDRCLYNSEKKQLSDICRHIDGGRMLSRQVPLKCVVNEGDKASSVSMVASNDDSILSFGLELGED